MSGFILFVLTKHFLALAPTAGYWRSLKDLPVQGTQRCPQFPAEPDHAGKRTSLLLNGGVDRDRAAIVTNCQGHRHRIRGPGQTGLLGRRGKAVTLRCGRRDSNLQIDAIDCPHEIEWAKPAPLEGARRDGRGKGADAEGHRLGGRIDPVAVLPKGELGQKLKGIGVGLLARTGFPVWP